MDEAKQEQAEYEKGLRDKFAKLVTRLDTMGDEILEVCEGISAYAHQSD